MVALNHGTGGSFLFLDDGAFGGNELAGGVVFVHDGFGGFSAGAFAQNVDVSLFSSGTCAAVDGLGELGAVTVLGCVDGRFDAACR